MDKRIFSGSVVLSALFAAISFADVPPDLVDAVEYQKKNKAAIVSRLQQRAVQQKQQKDLEGARETKKAADAVRSNKMLLLPPLGEAGDLPGTIDVEAVGEKTNTGYRIETSLPRLEAASGVDVRTGLRTVNPARGSEFIYYPQQIYVATKRELKKGERINVRRTPDGYAEISSSELEEAALLLKK